MSDSDTISASAKGKSIRFRSACNYCHSLKVKCSGDKFGCQRCRELHQDCHYSVSKVGKVPGVRSKAKSQSSSRSQSIPRTEPSFTPPLAKPFVDALPVSGVPAIPFADMDWSMDMHPQALDASDNMFPPGSLQPNAFPSTMPTDFPFHGLPPLDPSMQLYGDDHHLASGMTNPPVEVALSDSSSHQTPDIQHAQDFRNFARGPSIPLSRTNSTGTGVSQSSRASRVALSDSNGRAATFPLDDESAVCCILTCNQIIEDLNLRAARLRSGGRLPLDELLSVNKTTVTTLTRIINLPAFAENTTCPVLVAVAMEQIAALFEGCIAAYPELLKQRALRDSPADVGPEQRDATFPPLTLGSFCVEEGLVTQIRVRILCRELDRAIWALGQLADGSRQSKGSRGADAPTHCQWADNIAGKLRALGRTLSEER